jgi:hypothetical protein
VRLPVRIRDELGMPITQARNVEQGCRSGTCAENIFDTGEEIPGREKRTVLGIGSGACCREWVLSVFYRYDLLISKYLAPRHGFEPRFTAPKAAVLPLDDRGIRAEGCPQFNPRIF